MPEFSFHLPRFLRFHRSSRSHSSSANLHSDAAASNSSNLRPIHAVLSRPSSRQGALEQDTGIATATPCLPVTSSLIQPEDSPDSLGTGLALGDSNGQGPSPLSPPIVSICMPKCSPPDLTSRPPVGVPRLLDSAESTQSLRPSYTLATPSQQSLVIERHSQIAAKDLTPLQHQSQEVFKNAHDFSVVGSSFIGNTKGNITLTNNISYSNLFMEKLLKETIPGAASDSSARDPPPRCHPGTRLAILERCINFIAHCNGTKMIRWVVGGAGVGKSAIMQSVTESPELSVKHHASVFLSISGRNDGTKTIITLSYQLAAKCDPYRLAIEDRVNRDPSLLKSSMAVQFEKFIIQPFIHNPDINSAGRVLIIVDGLDESKETRTQVELLRLITNFCIAHPSSPIVWLIASRPEPHIISFFAKPQVAAAFEKEEVVVDSDEARADVERFLRHELKEIWSASDPLDSHWPDERHLWKLANAAGGLFAYAQTVTRYIGDSSIGDPAMQLLDVLNVIDELPTSELSREEHPMALLDALYARILSKIPTKIMAYARKLLLVLSSDWGLALHDGRNFIVLCNWLGMTADEAYAVLNRLRSVLAFPERLQAHKGLPKTFHKSFVDYISRSGFSADIKLEARQIMIQCAFRVLNEAPHGVDLDLDISHFSFYHGRLACVRGAEEQITITWPASAGVRWADTRTQLSMYQLAIGEIVKAIRRGDLVFQNERYIKLLTTQLDFYSETFPFDQLRDLAFDKARRHEFIEQGILSEIPANAINISKIEEHRTIKTQFERPVRKMALPDSWRSSCNHQSVRQTQYGTKQSWTSAFTYRDCTSCSGRLERQLESWKTELADHSVVVMFTSGDYCCVEVAFVDPEDYVSEWTYWFWLYLSSEERRNLGSTI